MTVAPEGPFGEVSDVRSNLLTTTGAARGLRAKSAFWPPLPLEPLCMAGEVEREELPLLGDLGVMGREVDGERTAGRGASGFLG